MHAEAGRVPRWDAPCRWRERSIPLGRFGRREVRCATVTITEKRNGNDDSVSVVDGASGAVLDRLPLRGWAMKNIVVWEWRRPGKLRLTFERECDARLFMHAHGGSVFRTRAVAP